MKQTPELDGIQRNMRPGMITRDGFLGNDQRNLTDILEEDDAAVKRSGLTHAAIAARMQELRDAGKKGLGESIAVSPHYEVRVDSVRGKLPCPFNHEGIFQKMNTSVCNLNNGKTISYTDLHIHMIKAHGFYEGHGSPFRIDPLDLIDVLEPAQADQIS